MVYLKTSSEYTLKWILVIFVFDPDAQFPVIANVNAQPMKTAAEIRTNLTKQINSPVLWEKSILQAMALGVDDFVEVGAKNVLTGLNGQIVPNLTTSNVETLYQ